MRERSEVRAFLRRLRQLALMIALVIVAGTIGLALTEDRGVWESFQWALDTVATIGSHPNPETVPGQVVKTLLIVLGVGTLFYGLVTVTEVFVAGHLADLLAERRTLKAIEATSDHYIICGFGRVGRQVARDLRAAGARYVVIDALPENRELAAGVGVRFIEGEATEDEVLRAAGIMRARGVIACVDSDADNIFITLSARELRPDIAIVARAASEASESKLVHAGATRVISPYGPADRRWRASRSTRRCRAWSTSRPSTAWRRSRWRRAARASAPRSPTSGEVRSSWACAPPTARSIPSRPRRPCSTPATS